MSVLARLLSLGDLVGFKRIQFRVGDDNCPVAGDTSFILRYCDGNPVLGMHVELFREEGLQTFDDPDFGREYDETTGEITVVPALYDRERMIFIISEKALWDLCNGQPEVDEECEGFEYEMEFEFCPDEAEDEGFDYLLDNNIE